LDAAWYKDNDTGRPHNAIVFNSLLSARRSQDGTVIVVTWLDVVGFESRQGQEMIFIFFKTLYTGCVARPTLYLTL
jgi:hypothetical protein